MRSAHALVLGILLALATPGARSQAKPSAQKPAAPAVKPLAQKPAPAPAPAKPAAKPAAPAAKPAAPVAKAAAKAAPKQSAQTAKPAARPAAKPAETAAKKPAKPAKAASAAKKPAAPAGAPAESEVKVARRDPFESLVGRQKSQSEAAKNLPPGKPGLQIGTLRLDGVVRSSNGMIAVVSNPQQRTYFLREGDQLYDGRVEKIMMDSVSFHEVGMDAFGKPVERQINKRIYASPGEQQ
jgi:Tfp pilus assembly protein PilP